MDKRVADKKYKIKKKYGPIYESVLLLLIC